MTGLELIVGGILGGIGAYAFGCWLYGWLDKRPMIYPWIAVESPDFIMTSFALYCWYDFVVSGRWFSLVAGMLIATMVRRVVGRSIMDMFIFCELRDEAKLRIWELARRERELRDVQA